MKYYVVSFKTRCTFGSCGLFQSIKKLSDCLESPYENYLTPDDKKIKDLRKDFEKKFKEYCTCEIKTKNKKYNIREYTKIL